MLPIDRFGHFGPCVRVCLFNSILSCAHTQIMWLSHSRYFVLRFHFFFSASNFDGLCPVCTILRTHTLSAENVFWKYRWIYSIVFYWCAFQLIATTNQIHAISCVMPVHALKKSNRIIIFPTKLCSFKFKHISLIAAMRLYLCVRLKTEGHFLLKE